MRDPSPAAGGRREGAPLVGRERERALLESCLAAALAGQGGLALIGGEAGIGKTALAEALGRAAEERGARFLVGRCYDLGETPPYGPWAAILARLPAAADPEVPLAGILHAADAPAGGSRTALFSRVGAALADAAAARPLVLLLDDLHWADPASLRLLRYVARQLDALPLLLVATYRDDELTRHHPLYALFPLLAREAPTTRVALPRLDDAAVRALVAARHPLARRDEDRLVAYLQARAAGNPFYLGELLHALEEVGLLRPATPPAAGWALGDLTGAPIPPLLRQVVEGRVARLGEEARRLLTVAAMIGQEVPLALWAAVGGADEEALLDVVERAAEARLLEEAPDGTLARFAHPLVREVLYAGVTPSRRRVWHRRVGEALAAGPRPDPDAVAYHFRQAGDPRAAAWLVRAGERAQRAYAWLMAAERYEAALALGDEPGEPPATRGWLLARLALLRRYTDPARAAGYLDLAAQQAAEHGDATLAAHARFGRGLVLCFTGAIRPGLAELAAGAAALDALPPTERARLGPLERAGVSPGVHGHRGTLAFWLALSGQHRDALALAGPAPPAGDADAQHALGFALAGRGRPGEARAAFTRARAAYRALGHDFHIGWVGLHELCWAVLPYHADDLAERRALAAEAVDAWTRASGVYPEIPPRLAGLPLLFVEGDWAEARRLALAAPATGWSAPRRLVAATVLGPLARAQGNADSANAVVRVGLPDGPATAPGGARFFVALALQRLAAALALDDGDLAAARAWLDAHDRWLAWGESLLGRAEGDLLWATYHRARGDPDRARQAAERALTYATEPRQPLALLAAHRLVGELAAEGGDHAGAAAHLAEALALAGACVAPYERALTLLALAGLRAAAGDTAGAREAIDEARAVCDPLGAAPALARVDALATRLPAAAPVPSAAPPAIPYPARLTAREVEILRLVAAGRSNREIAADLALSARTVERHVANIYYKIGAHNKADATAFAFRHHLV
ncbi:MAG TPA: AAA family ATPase [Thermomicrobiales bacterium]|nr:AAA family ATPase [Thermomicrobiales bacterium]